MAIHLYVYVDYWLVNQKFAILRMPSLRLNS